MQNVMNHWAQNDPAGAGRFIESLAAGKSRDSAIQTYVSQLSWQSPEFAAPFVNQITDDNQRYSAAQNLSHNYKRQDPIGYTKWLASLNLPPEKLKFLPK